jgi:hypothetical protein
MPLPYSADLRERVLVAYEHGEGTAAALARRFRVALNTVKNWVRAQGLRMKIARVFDGMEFGVVRKGFLRSGGPHVGENFGGRILGFGRSSLSRQDRAPVD